MPDKDDLPLRLHRMLSRLSREGGDPAEQATLGEAAARIVQLEAEVPPRLPTAISTADALRTARLLLERHGATEAWRLLTARAIGDYLAGAMRDQAITQQVLDALCTLAMPPGPEDKRH